MKVTEPGVYDMPAEVYHADPVPGGSLSSSEARLLLPPSCPAKYRWAKDNPPEPKRAFDFGHAAHLKVLGAGPELVVVDAENWRTKDAQERRDAAYAAGAVPLLAAEHDQVEAMAAAIRAHPVAGALFAPERGAAEQSLFWRDLATGVQLRARLDWLPHKTSGRMIIGDYKTAVSAEPAEVDKTIHRYGYHQQADWYEDGVLSLGLAEDVAFVFVVQEKIAPYVVTVVEPSKDMLMWGGVLNAKARDTYRWCVETGQWPGYADEIVLAQLPVYAERQYEIARQRGEYDTKEGSLR